MRILRGDVLQDIIRECYSRPELVYCIVMSTSLRRRQMLEGFRRYRERHNVTVFADSILFRDSKSIIDVRCLADRPNVMYDEIIFDSNIDDDDAVQKILQFERPREITDYGSFEPSLEILEYIIGGFCE